MISIVKFQPNLDYISDSPYSLQGGVRVNPPYFPAYRFV